MTGPLISTMRGLTAVFWGLPLALLAFARHFVVLWPTVYDLLLPILASGLLLFGVSCMGGIHPRERIWQRSVFTAQVLALVLTGLSPFLFLWSRAPSVPFYARAVLLLVAVAFALMVALTRMLARLSALLPDDTARSDARLFHLLSSYVVGLLAAIGLWVYVRVAPISLSELLALPRQPFGFARQAFLLLLALVPVAMAMSVSWKLKEVAMAMVVGTRRTG